MKQSSSYTISSQTEREYSL